ncbi:MAG: WYL domain-containing protein, partial [Chloroflexi bacterium]|nr:WYL domain-containing protein [Chloroflexota bacterium]
IRERKWSNYQEIADEPDGSVILRMNVCGLYDVTRWVLSWGSSAVVLEPQILRQKISEEARSITAQYSRR